MASCPTAVCRSAAAGRCRPSSRATLIRRREGGRAAAASRARATAQATEGNGDTTDAEEEESVPPGCSRYSVQVKRPLGLVLEEDTKGNIFVAEVVGACPAVVVPRGRGRRRPILRSTRRARKAKTTVARVQSARRHRAS